jgi:hypothetical protein
MARDVHGRATSSGSLPKRAIADAATLRDSKTHETAAVAKTIEDADVFAQVPRANSSPETQTAYRIGVQIRDLFFGGRRRQSGHLIWRRQCRRPVE